jgi:methionine synthase I (cobalamin-dependent)
MSLSGRLSQRLRAGEVVGVIDAALAVVRQRWNGPIGVYPEAGRWAPPEWILADNSPEMFALGAECWVARGVQLVGGCCGIRPDHTRALEGGLPSQLPTGTAR